MTDQPLSLDELLNKYNDYMECDEYHIHGDPEDTDYQGSTPLPHDFDEDKLKAAIERLLLQERLDELSRYSYPVDLTIKGLDAFWKRTDELKAELSSLSKDNAA